MLNLFQTASSRSVVQDPHAVDSNGGEQQTQSRALLLSYPRLEEFRTRCECQPVGPSAHVMRICSSSLVGIRPVLYVRWCIDRDSWGNKHWLVLYLVRERDRSG